MGRTIAATRFAGWLDDQLSHRGWGVRTLAKQMPGHDTEVARRALNRYLFEGAKPTSVYVTAIAAALGVPAADIPNGDDEEPRLRRAMTIDDMLCLRIEQIIAERLSS